MVQNIKLLPLTIKIVKVIPDFNFNKYLQLFTPPVIKSIYSYKFSKDQVVKFCSELLKRYHLADLTGDNPNDLEVIYNRYDKPFITRKSHAKEHKSLQSKDIRPKQHSIRSVLPDAPLNYINDKQQIIARMAQQSLHATNEEMCFNLMGCNLKFNISHAKDYVVIAVTDDPDYEIGIDIEYIDRNSTDFRDMAEIVYSDFEISQIKNVDDFFNLWTKKEALIKARGTGFGEDFYKTTRLKLDSYIKELRYSIYTTLFANEYYISICLLNVTTQSPLYPDGNELMGQSNDAYSE
jgi:phosphopantetheinyl transferase